MDHYLIRAYLLAIGAMTERWRRARADQAGEGVISAAIAVLIMAALGAIMWFGFQTIWEGASSQTNDQISRIGS